MASSPSGPPELFSQQQQTPQSSFMMPAQTDPTTSNQPTGAAFDIGAAPVPLSSTGAPLVGAPVSDLAHHWFFKVKNQWKPFTMVDSLAIEIAFDNKDNQGMIPTDGGRCDVDLDRRVKTPVYWRGDEASGKEDPFEIPIRRCSWFQKSNVDGRWVPYDEEFAQMLENEYQDASVSGRWNRKVDVPKQNENNSNEFKPTLQSSIFGSTSPAGKTTQNQGEYVTMHSPTVMLHFPSPQALMSSVDDWGQVQPQVS